MKHLTKPFRSIPIGSRFVCNGTEYLKSSTRTAKSLSANRVFYFGQCEDCRLV
jgi:hypothetical protein